MRALVIDPDVLAEVARVRRFAESNFFDLAQMKAKAGAGEPILTDKAHRMFLPVGFIVVFSIEQHPTGWCHHISISVDNPKALPHPACVTEIMKLFGMVRPLEECFVYPEGEEGNHQAINVISIIDPEAKFTKDEDGDVKGSLFARNPEGGKL